MAYTFYEVRPTGGILPPLREQEYGTAEVIKFATLDSCIGVVVKIGNMLCGVHLILEGADLTLPMGPLRAATGVWFNSDAAREIRVNLFRGERDNAGIVGHIDLWKNSVIPDVQDGYGTLISGFRNLETQQLGPARAMGARLIGGAINFFYWNP